jgi:hypothetical protein
MRLLGSLLVMGLMVVAPAALAEGGKGGGKGGARKGKGHNVQGVVAELKKDADNDNGYLTLQVQAGKKGKGGGNKGKALNVDDDDQQKDNKGKGEGKGKGKGKGKGEGSRRKFQVTPDTKFEILHEGKRDKATFKDLKEGQRVTVHPLDDRPNFAQLVIILKDPK